MKTVVCPECGWIVTDVALAAQYAGKKGERPKKYHWGCLQEVFDRNRRKGGETMGEVATVNELKKAMRRFKKRAMKRDAPCSACPAREVGEMSKSARCENVCGTIWPELMSTRARSKRARGKEVYNNEVDCPCHHWGVEGSFERLTEFCKRKEKGK